MGAQVLYSLNYGWMTCGECGMEFTAPQSFIDARYRDGKEWYCPAGHCRVYRETTEMRLRKELEAKERVIEMERNSRRAAESRARGLAAQKGKAEAAKRRLEQRVNAGVCPHCQRTVSQLARHIRTKHPEQVPHSHAATEKPPFDPKVAAAGRDE